MKKPIASVSRTKEILDQFNLSAKKGYGQNFIIEPNIVERIAGFSQCENACVIEIGPGIGALTQQLALRAEKVLAFEIDDRLIEVLSCTLKDYPNVEVVHQDFLKLDFEKRVQELKEKYAKVVLCANLPYYITTPILFKIFESSCPVDAICVMVQKEVGDRFCAKPSTKDYNALSVIGQYLYEIKTVMKIPKTIFNPKPKVDSSVVRFIPKQEVRYNQEREFFDFVKACFKQRRKTLYNNLREYYLDKEKAQAILEAANLSLNVRAEALEVEEFKRLYLLGGKHDER